MVFNSLNNFNIYNNTNDNLDDYIGPVKKTIKRALKFEGVSCACFNIIFISDDEIHEMNKKYRGIDRPTDVISFALEDSSDDGYGLRERVLGDIYISIDRARSQAKEYGHSLNRELRFLSVHGFLHLLGYDHMNEEDEKEMFSRQELILDGKR